MDFGFSINALLEETITRLDSRVLPRGNSRNNDRIRENRKLLFDVIDKMGEASAKAQGLYGAITGGRKLEMSDHVLYIMKDAAACNAKGAIVGFLKIGHKKLFVYDSHGQQHEMNPMCVLDFYVHESRQRQGCGKRLFEHMLRTSAGTFRGTKRGAKFVPEWENIRPCHFAIDKPSHKFSMFLQKHYNLRALIPQVNNFVVFDGFFSNRTDIDHGRSRNGRPPVYKPPGTVAVASLEIEAMKRTMMNTNGYPLNGRPPSGRINSRPPSGKTSQRYGMRPSDKATASHQQSPSPELRDLNINPRPRSGQRQNQPLENKNINPNHLDMRSLSAGSNSSRGLGAGMNMYSRHTITPPSSDNLQRHGSVERLHLQQQPTQDPGPPILQRAGPPPGYSELMNLHQEYQGRNGHLRSNSTNTLPKVQAPPSQTPSYGTRTQALYNPPASHRSAFSATPVQQDTMWTLHGVVPNHRTIGFRQNTHSRLW